MKILSIVLSILAVILLIYNFTLLDFSNLLGKESSIALIGVMACICALLLLAILATSKKIDKKIKEKRRAS